MLQYVDHPGISLFKKRDNPGKGDDMKTFEIKEDFYLDGEKVKIISGGMHYFRVVPEYWKDRLEN